MQGVLEELLNNNINICNEREKIVKATDTFLTQHSDVFSGWMNTFESYEKEVYKILSKAYPQVQELKIIRDKIIEIDKNLKNKTRDAITVLSYHCVIENQTMQKYLLSGELFRDWFNEYYFEHALIDGMNKAGGNKFFIICE